jgi:hypothetical protein
MNVAFMGLLAVVVGDSSPLLFSCAREWLLWQVPTDPPGIRARRRSVALRVTQGVARFGDRAGNIHEVHPGQTIYTPPGEEHFHAASGDTFMEHIAMLEAGDDPATTTTWLEHITDAEYGPAAIE